MTHFKKEQSILDEIKKEKAFFMQQLFNEKVFPKDILTRIDNINEKINKEMLNILQSENVDYKQISTFINELIVEKVYLNRLLSSTNYLKSKFNTIKSQSKIKTITENFDDGELKMKGLTSDLTLLKMDSLNSYYAIIQDLLVNIKNTKDLIDTTIMSLQSQLKNVSFEYINANKIHS